MPKLISGENLSNTIPLALTKKKYFPSISRFIPEANLFWEFPFYWLRIGAFFVITAALLALTVNQYTLYQKNRQILIQASLDRENLNKELIYWKEIADTYSNYPDVYLKIAALEYRLGHTSAAKSSIDKALSLNPDMEQGRVLGDQISRR